MAAKMAFDGVQRRQRLIMARYINRANGNGDSKYGDGSNVVNDNIINNNDGNDRDIRKDDNSGNLRTAIG
jgi:hypothetical protein